MTSSTPLRGMVVIEIGHSVAAPFAGLVFGRHAAEAAMQTHGGFAFSREYGIERKWRKWRKWRECRVYQIAPVSTNLILSHLAQYVLGLERSY